MAVDTQDDRYPIYPLFKGLQKPLEFMGIQGRYIYWAAASVGGAVIGFILAYCFFGFVIGLITLAIALLTGMALIFVKQKKGLHTKKEDRGVYIYAFSKRM